MHAEGGRRLSEAATRSTTTSTEATHGKHVALDTKTGSGENRHQAIDPEKNTYSTGDQNEPAKTGNRKSEESTQEKRGAQ